MSLSSGMRKWRRCVINVCAFQLLAACSLNKPAEEPSGGAASLTPEQRSQLAAVGGEALVADAERIVKDKDTRGLFEGCIGKYAEDLSLERKGSPSVQSEAQMHTQARIGALMTCQITCNVKGHALTPVLSKYKKHCDERFASVQGSLELTAIRGTLDVLRNATTALSMESAARSAKANIEEQLQKLGKDNTELQQLQREYEELAEPRKVEITRAAEFLARPDIVDMRAEANVVAKEIELLKKRYAEYRVDSTRQLIEIKTRRLETLEQLYEAEGKKAGVR